MTWNDSSSWIDTMVWIDSDGLSVVFPDEVVNPNPNPTVIAPVDPVGFIQQLIPLSIVGYGLYTSDTEIASSIPAGMYLDKIIVIESAGHTGQISGGINSGGVELFSSAGIAGSDSTAIDISKYFPEAESIFLHHAGDGDAWNSMEISIYLLLFRL